MSGSYADYNMSLFNGIDKEYSTAFFAFINEFLHIKRELITVDKTDELLQKHFQHKETINKDDEQQKGELISIIWGLVVLVIGLREIHSTTTPRALFSLLLPFFIIIVFALVVAVYFASSIIFDRGI